MTQTFFATFASGAENIVREILNQLPEPPRILSLLEGAVVFRSSLPAAGCQPPCFNNLFVLLHTAAAKPDKAGLERFLRALPACPVNWAAARPSSPRAKSFRLVTSCQNQLTGVSKAAKEALEKKLSAQTRLKVDRSLPDQEFWVLVRSEGRGYFMKRLTRHKAYDKLLHPGELHPEIAYMLCWLAGPRPGQVILDPFCGYGAIPAQMARRFPACRPAASDTNEEAIRYTRQRLPQSVAAEKRDALRLPHWLPAHSVDAIVTDPPWGLYQTAGVPLAAFYQAMLQAFAAVLKPGGRAVILTAGKEDLLTALENAPFCLAQRHDLLVSGKKAAVFLLTAEE